MNYIVLVKQVPDVKNIPEEAWNWEKGILRRGMLDNVCNELDKQALAFAVGMRKEHGGKIVALTMGPPFADEVLRYALSIGADLGVLLTDRKLGGADTAATAYPLAQTIRKIEKEIFSGDKEYIIISGMQSVDGDTAQVPPQVAEELGIPQIAYATAFKKKDNGFTFSRITRRGTQEVVPLSYPFVVTVTDWTLPLSATFNRTRWAHNQSLYVWSAEDVEANEELIGLAGSRTNVYRIFSPRETTNRKCLFEPDFNKLAEAIKTAYSAKLESVGKQEEAEVYKLPEDKEPSYHGEVWIFAEQEDGEINPASMELLSKTKELATQLKTKTGALLIGKDVKHLTDEVITCGADKVYVVENEIYKEFLPIPYTAVVSELIEKHKPQIMLFSATPLGRELAPRVAYRTRSGLTADCTSLDIFDFKRGSQEYTAILRQTRPALGGSIMAQILTQKANVQMSTVRPGLLKVIKCQMATDGEVIEYQPDFIPASPEIQIISKEIKPPTSGLTEASIIVSGGGGCKTKEGFDRYIPALAEHFGKFLGQKAVVGASRLAVESGFIDRSHQVGQTGQTVTPRLYVAVGISGAVQHLSGMQNSDVIVAINRDPNAQIFRAADFCILGDLEQVVPELINALNAKGL
ncbi:MAG: FAD-binding protein [Dehalococcoidales bacterium]